MLGSPAPAGNPSELVGRVGSGVIGEAPRVVVEELGGEPETGEGEGEGEGECEGEGVRDARACEYGRDPPPKRRELASTAVAIPSATRATAMAHRPRTSVC